MMFLLTTRLRVEVDGMWLVSATRQKSVSTELGETAASATVNGHDDERECSGCFSANTGGFMMMVMLSMRDATLQAK